MLDLLCSLLLAPAQPDAEGLRYLRWVCRHLQVSGTGWGCAEHAALNAGQVWSASQPLTQSSFPFVWCRAAG